MEAGHWAPINSRIQPQTSQNQQQTLLLCPLPPLCPLTLWTKMSFTCSCQVLHHGHPPLSHTWIQLPATILLSIKVTLSHMSFILAKRDWLLKVVGNSLYMRRECSGNDASTMIRSSTLHSRACSTVQAYHTIWYLISIGKLDGAGCYAVFEGDGVTFVNPGGHPFMYGRGEGTMYEIDVFPLTGPLPNHIIISPDKSAKISTVLNTRMMSGDDLFSAPKTSRSPSNSNLRHLWHSSDSNHLRVLETLRSTSYSDPHPAVPNAPAHSFHSDPSIDIPSNGHFETSASSEGNLETSLESALSDPKSTLMFFGNSPSHSGDRAAPTASD